MASDSLHIDVSAETLEASGSSDAAEQPLSCGTASQELADTPMATDQLQDMPSPNEDDEDDALQPSDRATPSGSQWKKHVWKAAEDEQLHHLVATALQDGGKVRWSAIGAQMDGRSGKQCREVRVCSKELGSSA